MVTWVQGGSSGCPTTPWRTLPHGDPGGGVGTGWDGSPGLQTRPFSRPFSESAPEGPTPSPPPSTVGFAPDGPASRSLVCGAALAPLPVAPAAPRWPATAGRSAPAPPAARWSGPAAAVPTGVWRDRGWREPPHVPGMLRLPLTPNNSGAGNRGPRASRTPGSSMGDGEDEAWAGPLCTPPGRDRRAAAHLSLPQPRAFQLLLATLQLQL